MDLLNNAVEYDLDGCVGETSSLFCSCQVGITLNLIKPTEELVSFIIFNIIWALHMQTWTFYAVAFEHHLTSSYCLEPNSSFNPGYKGKSFD